MVTPSDTASPPATPANAPGAGAPAASAPARKGGRGGGGGKDGGKTLTIVAINRRVEALQKLEDPQKKNKGRQRLLRNILTGIADGSVKQPNKAAEAILTLMVRKGGKGKDAPEATADEG